MIAKVISLALLFALPGLSAWPRECPEGQIAWPQPLLDGSRVCYTPPAPISSIIDCTKGGCGGSYASPEDRSWHLLTQSQGGTVSLIKDLTKKECEFARNRTLGQPATEAEQQAAVQREKKREEVTKQAHEEWLQSHLECKKPTSEVGLFDAKCIELSNSLINSSIRMVSPGDIKSAECFQ